MTDKIEHLMLEQFRRLRDDIAKIQVSLDNLRQGMQATRHHTRGLELTSDVHSDDIDDLRRRVDRIERRLDLNDPGFSESPSPYEPRPTKRG